MLECLKLASLVIRAAGYHMKMHEVQDMLKPMPAGNQYTRVHRLALLPAVQTCLAVGTTDCCQLCSVWGLDHT